MGSRSFRPAPACRYCAAVSDESPQVGVLIGLAFLVIGGVFAADFRGAAAAQARVAVQHARRFRLNYEFHDAYRLSRFVGGAFLIGGFVVIVASLARL